MRRQLPSLNTDLVVFGLALFVPTVLLAGIAAARASSWPALILGGVGLGGALAVAAVAGGRIAEALQVLRAYAANLEAGRSGGLASVQREGEMGQILTRIDAALHRHRGAAEDSRAHYQALTEGLPVLVCMIDGDGAVVFQNRRATEYTGGPALCDWRSRESIVHPDEQDRVRQARDMALREGRESQIEVRLRAHDGNYRWHQLTAAPSPRRGAGADGTFWIVTAFDIESLKQAERLQEQLKAVLEQKVADATRQLRDETVVRQRAEGQLRETQKMEAISRLTGGIAHDLNNKLMVISANIDAVSKQLKDQPPLTRKLLAALVASDQAAALMSKLLAFARKRDLHAQYIDVADQLQSVTELLDRSFLSNSVQVRLSVPQDLWPVNVDPQQLETAIINLAVNARDAMPGGGLITIEAQNASVAPGRLTDPSLSGDFVQIVLHDTGSGIPPEHLEHVFEPFFTTKGASQGTGLGLSQVHGFMKQLGGTVEIDSAVGEGTSVALFLPRADLPARVGSRTALEDLSDDEAAPAAAAEILIVDDEVEVALALQGMIKELGYAPRIAIGAGEALDAIATHRPRLILSDVTMPGTMDGVALGREIRRRFGALPVVLITGNPMVVAEDSEFPLLQKPITSRDLNAALNHHLSAAPDENVVRLFSDGRRGSPSHGA